MEQTNSLLELPSKEEWYPYIKPTRHKHESGFYCFEVGYCQVGERADIKHKIVLGGLPPDHVAMGEGFSSTYERIADTGNERDGGPVYAYVKKPVINTNKNVVFEQTLEDLDVTAVIRAANKIT